MRARQVKAEVGKLCDQFPMPGAVMAGAKRARRPEARRAAENAEAGASCTLRNVRGGVTTRPTWRGLSHCGWVLAIGKDNDPEGGVGIVTMLRYGQSPGPNTHGQDAHATADHGGFADGQVSR